MSESLPEPVSISVIWPEADEHAVLTANQFVTQLAPGPDGMPEELILVVGHLAPPLVLGSAEEQQAMMNALGALSVKIHARYSLSRGRLQELIGLLQNAAHNWDNAGNGGQP